MVFNNLVPSWSSCIFISGFLLGSYSFYSFFSQRKKGRTKVSSFLWGTFLMGVSLFFLGNEYHLWNFLTAKSTIIGVLGAFSLALILSTLFIENKFYKISFWVPAVALLFLGVLATLVFARIELVYPPLWFVNCIFIFLFAVFIFLRLFLKKVKAY